jgi:hypothetical protein
MQNIMAQMYVVRSSDNIRITSQGDVCSSIWFQNIFSKPTWERMGIMKGRFPHIVLYDKYDAQYVRKIICKVCKIICTKIGKIWKIIGKICIICN